VHMEMNGFSALGSVGSLQDQCEPLASKVASKREERSNVPL
jgi:hypothetical protein